MNRFLSGAWRRAAAILLVGVVGLALAACSSPSAQDDSSDGTVEAERLVLASTTSTQDSGLFDTLIPAFEAAHPECEVNVLAVGTGEALALGERKDADVLLVHARDAEDEFVAAGFGTERADVMYNDFVLVGPADDPAHLTQATNAASALVAIADAGAPFVSRGDDSGTHKKELALWDATPAAPTGDWYLSTGQGMGDVLTMASELLAYTMTDRATYLNMRDALDIEILFEGDTALLNQYGVVPVTGAANPTGAQSFLDWITGPDGQGVIETYGVDTFGQPLFFPNAE